MRGVRFDVLKWLDLNGPAGATATGPGIEGGPSGTVRIELAGDDDEANMKAKREADAAEKRFVSSFTSLRLSSHSHPLPP